MGDDTSVEGIRAMFKAGVATKELYTEALKGYRDAEDTKSPEREEAQRLRNW